MAGGEVTCLAVSREQQRVLCFRDFLYLEIGLQKIFSLPFSDSDSVVIPLRMGYTLHESDIVKKVHFVEKRK